jgi:lauroyl/myristoyl acyltransferase
MTPLDLLRSPRLLALWCFVHLIGRLPFHVLYPAADALGTLAWLASPRLRIVTRDHMRHVLGLHPRPAAIDAAARGCVRSAARYWVDLARRAHLPEPLRFHTLEGAHHLVDTYRQGRGLIMYSAHLGNPEMMAQAVADLGIDMLVLTEPLEPPALDRLVHQVRAAGAPGVRFIAADLAGIRAAIEQLRAGGALAVLADRDVLRTGVPVTFFGEHARLPGGIADLALRTGAAVVPGFAIRNRDGSIRGVVRPPLTLPRSGDRESDLAEARRLIAQSLEAGIALAPDQWFPLSPIWSGLASD